MTLSQKTVAEHCTNGSGHVLIEMCWIWRGSNLKDDKQFFQCQAECSDAIMICFNSNKVNSCSRNKLHARVHAHTDTQALFFIHDRLRNDLYCVEWDVKLYYTIPISSME